jgi:hypothetical protein
MQGPAIYRIVVGGKIEGHYADRLEGMNITQRIAEDGGVESVLVGRLADQSALSGVLNTLYELHRPVRSVGCLENR